MEPTNIASLITNLGFPIVLSFILLRYILQTFGKKFDILEETITKLTDAIERLSK